LATLPQELHLAELRPVRSSSPTSQKGQTSEPDLDVIDERFIWPPSEALLCSSLSRMD
jgi:hypothetical protein